MPFDLLTKTPREFPATVSAPSDSDPPTASGQLRTVLQQLKDRTDFTVRNWRVGEDAKVFPTNAVIRQITAPAAGYFATSTSTTIAITDAFIGDMIHIDADLELAAVGAGDVRCAVFLNGTKIDDTERTVTVTAGVMRTAIMTRKTVTVAGTQTMEMRVEALGADDVILRGPGCIRAYINRP